jgi:hypothetical protein
MNRAIYCTPLYGRSVYIYIYYKNNRFFLFPCLLTCLSTRKILFHVDIIVASAGSKTRVRRMTHERTATTRLGQDCLSEGSQVDAKHFTDNNSQNLIHHLPQVRDGKLADARRHSRRQTTNHTHTLV